MAAAAATVRVGLVGFGNAGQIFHTPLISSVPGLQLVAVASSDAARVTAAWPAVRVVADYLQLVQDSEVDLVVIASPNATHYPLATAALTAGKHVVVDKPFTVTLSEADSLIALAKERGLLLSVFHNRRYDGDFLTLREVLASGVLGTVREVVSRFDSFSPVPRVRWREQAGPGGGLWYDLGPHLLDQALQLFGMPQTVQADIAILRDGSEAPDYAQVVLGYEKQRVTLHCTRVSAHFASRFEVHGDKGSFHSEGLDVQEDQLKASRTAPLEPGYGVDSRPVMITGADRKSSPLPRQHGDYKLYYAGIYAAITSGGPNPVPPEQARNVMYVLLLADESARLGQRLPVVL